MNNTEYLQEKLEQTIKDKSNSILNDIQIIELGEKGMITPFVSESINVNEQGEKILSYGVSSFGYDIRLGNEFSEFEKSKTPLDVKDQDTLEKDLYISNDYWIIPPNDMVLAKSVEIFDIPRDIQVICLGKSTYARVGLVVNVTPLEAGWTGQLVLELSNTTKRPIKVYVNEGCAQLLFLKGNECKTSYADRKGKYQNQSGITGAKV